MTIHFLVKKSLVCMTLALAFSMSVPVGHAVSAKSLEKQAKKIESKLAKFPKGAFLRLTFRDGSERTGKLRQMSEDTFSFTNSESNVDETHNYIDVKDVEKSKTYIGKNSNSKSGIHLPF